MKASDEFYQQHELKQVGYYYVKMTCWLPADKLKVGWQITLEEEAKGGIKQWWRVEKIYSTRLKKKEIKDAHESRKWYGKDFHGTLKGLQAKNE